MEGKGALLLREGRKGSVIIEGGGEGKGALLLNGGGEEERERYY